MQVQDIMCKVIKETIEIWKSQLFVVVGIYVCIKVKLTFDRQFLSPHISQILTTDIVYDLSGDCFAKMWLSFG